MRRLLTLLMAVALTAWVFPSAGLSSVTAAHADSYNGLGQTPTMGWNDWNAYGCNNDAADVEANALYIHNSGLQADGYQYIVNDGCWNDIVGVDPTTYPGNAAQPAQPDPGGGSQTTLPTTAEETACGVVNGRGTGIRPAGMPAGENPVPAGQLFINPYLFPPSAPCANDGFRLVSNYVHSLGLKFGLWLDASDNWNGEEIPGSYGPCSTTYGCQNGVPSYDQEDANTFSSWGVDFIKADWVGDSTKAPTNDPMPYGVPAGSPACYTQTNETFSSNTTAGSPCPSGTPSPGQGALLPGYTSNSFVVPALTGYTDQQLAQTMYTALSNAVAQTGRPMILNLCVHNAPANAAVWFSSVGNSVKPDLNLSDTFASFVSMANDTAQYSQYAGPGHFLDPDMLEVGNGGMTQTEDQAQFSIWSEMASPLIMGTNMATQSDPAGVNDVVTAENQTAHDSVNGVSVPLSTNHGINGTGQSGQYATPAQDAYDLAIFGNQEVIAVDQDPLGAQGHVVSFDGTHQILAKPLANGDVAVTLFNEGSTPATMSTTATAVGLPGTGAYSVRDLWAHTTSQSDGTISAYVQPHQVVMYRISPLQVGVSPSSVTVVPTAGSSVLTPGQSTTVTVTITNNGRNVISGMRLTPTLPSGWTATALSFPSGQIPSGHSITAYWQITAPAASAPISAVTIPFTLNYVSSSQSATASAPLALTEVSPVSAPFQTIDTTGNVASAALFGELGSSFAIQAAGAVTTTADQYGAIYQSGILGTANSITTTVTATPGAATGSKAGLMVRNTFGSAPEGVLLYVTPSRGATTVQAAWGSGGANYSTTSTAVTVASGLPVTLKITRTGATTYTAWYSTNGGATWTQVGSTITVASAAATQSAGLFQTSGTTTRAEADFSGFTVS